MFFYHGLKIKIDAWAKIFTHKDLQNVPTKKGIYIMFENGQVDERGRKRIVRVGKADNLHTRLVNHFEGRKGKSIFRKHVQGALGTNKEEDISNYIQENISYALVILPDGISPARLEAALITMIADYSKNLNVENWLGAQSKNKTIRKYKIWNVQHCANKKKAEIGLDDCLMDLFDNGLLKSNQG